VLLLIVPNLYHSTTATGLSNGALVTCDGNTRIDFESRECHDWGEEVLAGDLGDVRAKDVTRIDIERAFFGFIDRCTATVRYSSPNSTGTFDQVTPCR
jgi:hypothetical protein